MISSKTVIAKAIADFNLQEDQIRISDWKEWLLEGMLKIGAIQQFEHKVEVLPIECHQVSLPCDLYKLDQVLYKSSNINQKNLQAKVLDGTGKLQKKLVSLYTYLMTIVIIISIDSFGQRKIVYLLIKLSISLQLQEIIRGTSVK